MALAEEMQALLDKAAKVDALEFKINSLHVKLDWIRHYVNATRYVVDRNDEDRVGYKTWIDEESRRKVCHMYRGEKLREEVKEALER